MISYYLSIVESDEDREKVAYIYENFYSFMVYTAKQVLKDNDYQIEDAVHTSMIKIIENLDLIDLTDIRRAKNFCAVVSRNTAIDMCKLKDNQNISMDSEIVQTLEDENDPTEIVIKEDTYKIIMREIYSLSDTYRDICLLKYINRLKEREIALILNLPPKTVNVRIFRARQILKKALRKENIYV